MNMHHVLQLVDRSITTHQYADFLHYICSMGAKGVTTKDESIVSRRKQFEHAIGLVHRQCLTIGTPKSLMAFIIDSMLLQLVFARTYTSSFRLGEDGGRHNLKTDMITLAQKMIHRANGLHLCSMCQHLLSIDITNGINAFYRCLKIFINRNALSLVVFETSSY